MTKPHSGVDLEQPCCRRRGRGLAADPEPLGRPPDQNRIPDRFRRGHQQQSPRR
jgi:hypothetical protein